MAFDLSWRSISTAERYRHHDIMDFAQEFLQRNPAYRQDYAATQSYIAGAPCMGSLERQALASRWGLSYPSAPLADPRTNPALWSPTLVPHVVLIETADGVGASIGLMPECELLAQSIGVSEQHFVFAHGTARLRLCVRHGPTRLKDSLVTQRDKHSLTRLAAALRFERVARGGRATINAATMPTRYQRGRLAMFLAISDALEAGASNRDVAFEIVFPNHRPLVGAAWKGSGERRHVVRLIAETRDLVNGGYRKLLLPD